MKLVGVLGLIVCCGLLKTALSASTDCVYLNDGVAPNLLYTCILSNAEGTSVTENIGGNLNGNSETTVKRAKVPTPASDNTVQALLNKFRNLEEIEMPLGNIKNLAADSALFGIYGALLKKIQLKNGDVSLWASKAFERCIILTDLDLSSNKIATIQANADDGLVKLERLNLADNQVSTLPVFNILTTLKVFNVSGNLITALSTPLPSKTTLEIIDLSRNKITTISIDYFKDFAKLKEISLRENPLTALDANSFNALNDLTILNLGSTKLTNFDFLKKATKLQTLNLTDTAITQFTDNFFEGNLDLVRLYAANNKLTFITTSAFSKVASKLVSIDVSRNRINRVDQDFFTSLTALTAADFTCNQCISQSFTAKPADISKQFEVCSSSSIIISSALTLMLAVIPKFI